MGTGPDHKGSSDQTTIIYILSRAGINVEFSI